MIKHTSLEAYRKVKESGILSKQREQVFEWFCEFAPCTINELINRVGDRHKPLFREPNHINKIPCQLQKHKVIEPYTSRNCRVTGNLSEVWRLTGNDPVKIKRKKPYRTVLMDTMQKLMEINDKEKIEGITEIIYGIKARLQ